MAISIDRLSGGNTPADGSDPRTFPAIWNTTAALLEANVGTGASVTVSETEPASPAEGDLWLNSTEAKMYVYYDDGDSEQWVAAVGGTVPSQGKILQVVSTAKTDVFSTTSSSFTTVTGLSATITPTSATSKILVFAQLAVGGVNNARMGHWKVTRGGTDIYVGDSAGSRIRTVLGGYTTANVADFLFSFPVNYLDSPASTSALTYQVEARRQSAGTIYLNRTTGDADDADSARGASSITLMEVAG